jgi:hypothetical protein
MSVTANGKIHLAAALVWISRKKTTKDEKGFVVWACLKHAFINIAFGLYPRIPDKFAVRPGVQVPGTFIAPV